MIILLSLYAFSRTARKTKNIRLDCDQSHLTFCHSKWQWPQQYRKTAEY